MTLCSRVNKPVRVIVSVIALAGAAFVGGRLMFAQSSTTRTWDGGGADNNWSTAGNWSAENAPDGTSEAAVFTNDPAGQTKRTPNLSADVTIGQLQFSATAPSYTISGTGPSTLFLSPVASYGGVGVTVASGAASQTISAAEVEFLSSQTWDIGGTTALTVTGTIEDDSVIDYGLTKNGTGTLVFPGDVRYDGATVVNAGALVLSFSNTSMLSALTVNGGVLRATTSVNALGNSGTRNTITLAGGALDLGNNTGITFGSTSRITTVTGNATIRSDRLTAGAGVTHTLGTLRIGAQTLSVTAGTNVTSGTAGATFGATTLLGNATLDVANSGSANAQLTLGAVAPSGGTRSLTKTGTGTLRLNGAASYTGGTTLSQGALTLGVANALGSGGFNFAGGSLNANNTTDSSIGALTLTANSTLQLSPAGAAATLTFSGVSGTATGILTITGWSGSAGGLGTNDKILFSGGTAPNADFLQHIRFDLGDGQTYVGGLGTGGELFPMASSSDPDEYVAGTTGAIGVVAMPTNLNGGQFISQTQIRLMHEGTGMVTAAMSGFQADGARHDPALATGQPADATFANAIVTPYAGPGLPAAGTPVHSILLHFDPNVSGLPFDLSQGVAQSATITFDRPIIGAYVTSSALDVTDSVFGSGTVYPNGNIGRDMEFNYDGDSFAISADRLTLSLTMFSHNGGVLDEMRVILPLVSTATTVPSVVGQTQAQASSTLSGVGLVASATTQPSPTIPLGNVIAQNPSAGSSVVTGSTVTLVVSAGVTVPSVVGQTQSSATTALQTAGLAVSISTQPSTTVSLGSVMSQNPAASTQVSGGSTVALVISSGPPANITLANVQSAQSTTSGSVVDLVYTVPDIAGSQLVLVVYGGGEASTTNLALPTGATFHGVALNVAAQHRTPATGINAGSGLYWLPVSARESGTIRVSFTGACDERAVGVVTLVGAALTGPEVVEIASGTASLTDSITTRSANAMVISTATQGNSGALTATGTGHLLDVSAALASSRLAGGHSEVAAPSSRTLGYSGSINRIAMILASFPVGAPELPPVSLPDLTHTLQTSAQAVLTALGLQTGVITNAYSSTVAAGYVISQSPAAGVSVPGGSSVNLLVSLGPAPNVPPSVTLTAPADRAMGLGSSALLTASVTDADATTVTFYGRKTVPAVPRSDFVIGTLPDTRFYSQNTGGNLAATFLAQTQWYADSRSALNLAFVSHLGNMVHSGDNGTDDSEWIVADSAMRAIEDPVRTGLAHGIPWGGAPGNYDQTTLGQANAPNAKWNQFFGADRWTGRPYFGGSFSPTNHSNNYQLFEASGLEFLIIHLDYTTADAVSQAVIDWADGLMKAYPHRRVIVTSHWILDAPPTTPAGASAPFGGPGQRFFDEFKDNPNFFLMLGGDVSGEGHRTDVVGGRSIHSVLQGYQDRANGGDGWLRYFVFSPANNTVTAKTCSPTLDQCESDTDGTSSPLNQASEFVLPYDMRSAVAPWTVLGTVNGAAGGGSAQFNWTGLEEHSTYEWYVGASDGSLASTSAVRTFATSNNVAPTVALTSPANNALFSAPVDVTLTATAADADGAVTRVEFFDGSAKLGEDSTPPYSYTWVNVPVGGHMLRAVATDDVGASATSTFVAVTVNAPPTVTLTAPANNAVFTTPVNVTLTASAGDTDGTVSKVEFFQGGTKLGEATVSPYSYTWNGVQAGIYSLTARATDNRNATTISSAVNITVRMPSPPGTPGTPAPANLATGVATTAVLTWSAAGATSYDLNFGTTSPPGLRTAGLTSATASQGPLSAGTVYFWQIVARNADGTTAGPVWSFTTAAAPSQATYGLTTIGSVLDGNDSNFMQGSLITTIAGGAVVSVSAYVGPIDSSAASRSYQVAIYTNSGGRPGTLVARSASGTLTANAWNTIALPATLQAGTSYWLLYNTNGRSVTVNNLRYNVGSQGQGIYGNSPTTFGTWPSTFPASTLTTARYSLYVTVQP